MTYKAIGLMSGSSLDGLDIVFAAFSENAGTWNYEILSADCYEYSAAWIEQLKNATTLNARDYCLLHTAYGRYLGEQVNRFIKTNDIQYQVGLVASHGHTTFHEPNRKMTGQIGDGAAIAAETQLPVVSDLRALDVAFGGQGAPIVPIGEKLLLSGYDYFLNVGGIANISLNEEHYKAFDICAANRVLNMLAQDAGKEYDDGGNMAKSGQVVEKLLSELNELEYYRRPYPKSLANSFGIETVYPMVKKYDAPINDLLRTYTEHIAQQINNAIATNSSTEKKLLATGGGAFNIFLIERLQNVLKEKNITVTVPDENLVKYKEALMMALIGVLRWREEYNVIRTVTGAQRASIGGALWLGGEE
jgi:anhydro-N-acetylmuramic acid kinase